MPLAWLDSAQSSKKAFTFADIEFFWNKCHDYLERIYTKTYNEDTAQAWKDQYIQGQNEFRQLDEESPTEETEVTLKAWEAKLWPTYKNMEDALRNLQWAPDKDAFMKWDAENNKQNQFLAEMKADIVILRWIVKEILRIVNPQNPEYKQWHMDNRVEEIHSRRDFLVKIGKPNVQPGPSQRFWRPREQIGDIHVLLRQLKNM
jgi:hypothetical protein